MENWYSQLEEPVRDLVRLLRNEGFNTTCSCGHLPNPYLQFEWYDDRNISRIYNLLSENDYRNFEIQAFWLNNRLPDMDDRRRFIEIRFHIARQLAKISDIRN